MAEIRQGYLDDYTQITNGNIGIGTSVSNEKLEIIGGTTSQELNVTGISTFAHVSGFIKKHTDYAENVNITAGDSGTLSGEIVVGAGLTMTVGTAATASQGSVDSLKVSQMFQPPSGGTNQRPPAKPGAIFYNFDFKTIEFFDGNSWRQVDNTTQSGRGLVIGGYTPSPAVVYKDVQTFNISTKGNSTYFGDTAMTSAYETAGFGSRTRAFNATDGSYTQQIDYYTLATQSNGIDFGNLTGTYGYGSAFSSQTRGVISAGFHHPSPSSDVNVIDYVEMATTGNALDFGDHTNVGNTRAGLSDGVRGVWAGNGGSPSPSTEVQLNIISSKGNSVTYGDLSHLGGSKGASNSTRGIINNIKGTEAYQLDSGGNSIPFGDLTTAAYQSNVCASQTRVVIAGGHTPTYLTSISFVTIATLGGAEDFGDLSRPTSSGAACSDCHGGLGGF